MGAEDGDPPTFVRLLAYSTGLCLGVWIVHILRDRTGAPPRKGNRMGTPNLEAPETAEQRYETKAEYTLRIQSAIRRGDADYEAGRTLTHEEFKARMAPWLAG